MTGDTRVKRIAAPLRQQVVDDLREAIQDGEMSPGERLVEGPLCERFGVSRTVVREALRQLEAEDLVTMIPNRGPVVAVLTTEDVRSLYSVRRSLEGLAGAEFAAHADDQQRQDLSSITDALESVVADADMHTLQKIKDDFYVVLLDGARNKILASMLASIHGRTRMARRFSMRSPGRPHEMVGELRRITDAAVRGDAAKARAACEAHIERAGVLALRELEAEAARTQDSDESIGA